MTTKKKKEVDEVFDEPETRNDGKGKQGEPDENPKETPEETREIAKTEPPGELVHHENPVIGGGRGIEDFGAEHLVIPRLKVVQLSSEEASDGIRPGSLVNSLTKDVVAEPGESKTVERFITVINYRPTRIYMHPIDAEDSGVICRSFDAKIGVGEYEPGSKKNPSGLCANCPMSRWWKDDKGKQKAPLCNFMHHFYVLVEGYEFELPLVLALGKTSQRAGNLLGTFLKPKPNDTWHYRFKLKTKYFDDSKGRYWVFDVLPAGPSSEEHRHLGEFYYQLLQEQEVEVHDSEFTDDDPTKVQAQVDDAGDDSPGKAPF